MAPTSLDPAAVPTLLPPLVVRPDLTPPFENDVLVFAIAMLVFLVAPLALQRYRIPGIVGIILIGAAIGPEGLHLLERADVELLGTVGIVYLMFVAGLEINLAQFLEYRDRSVVFGGLSFLVPQAAGTVVGVALLGLELGPALLYAAIFASHTLLAYPVVNRLGIATNEAMTATIGGTILTDTVALLVLAVVLAADEGDLTAAFWLELGVGLTLFFLGVWFLVPRIGRWFFRIHDEESYFEFLFVMVVLFASAFLAELAGVEHIVGAFLAGLALNRLIPESGPLMNRIEFVGNALFIPFFLLSVGMLVDVTVLLEGSRTLEIAASLIVLVVVTKYAAAWLTGRIYGYTRSEIAGMFGLSVGQAAAALAIVLIAYEAGLPGFDEHMINGVVLMILVVSLISPTVVSRAGSEIARTDREAAYDPSALPQRILVPTSRESRYRESLLDLALAIRENRSEPIHALSVVRPGEERETEAEVAAAAELLEGLEEYAAGAEVPIVGHARVNHNVASGIVNAGIENRITTIVIGWDGARSREQYVFGHVIDQVLHRAGQLTLVARLREPLNTTRRLVVVLPPGIEHNEGVYEAVHTIKRLATQTGAPVRGLAVDADPEAFDRLFDRVDPDAPAEFEAVDDWSALRSRLPEVTGPDDLVVCTSARRDEPGWHPELQTLPARVSRITDENFVVVYPAKPERVDDRRFLRFT